MQIIYHGSYCEVEKPEIKCIQFLEKMVKGI